MPAPNSHKIEAGLMFTMAAVGGVGNLGIVMAILCCQKFRSSVTAFLCHHSLLDFLKAIYCVPFGYSLLHGREPNHCNLIGASYIVIVTTSAYNLLGLIVNEEYQLTDYGPKRQSNYCCVLFGVFMIWFSSVLLNLGVAFIPGNPEYNYDIGNCIFTYGIPNNFVLHVLWMVLMTAAILLAYLCSFILYRKIVRRSRGHKWAYIHRSVSREINSPSGSTESINNADSDDDVLQPRRCYAHLHLRRVIIMASLITAFVVFWYPVFILTLADPKYRGPKKLYQALTILAWSQPVITPVFSILILHDIGCIHHMSRDVYVNEIPLHTTNETIEQPTGHLTFSWNAADNVIFNEHFASENQPNIVLPPRLATAENSSLGTPTSSMTGRRPSTLDYRPSTASNN